MGSAQFRLVPHVAPAPTGLAWRVVAGEHAVAWRLLGANNRELGRSAAVFHDEDSCWSAVRQLVTHVAALRTGLTQDVTTGQWTWRLDAPGGALARSGRGYARQRECRYALDAFRTTAPVALVGTAKESAS